MPHSWYSFRQSLISQLTEEINYKISARNNNICIYYFYIFILLFLVPIGTKKHYSVFHFWFGIPVATLFSAIMFTFYKTIYLKIYFTWFYLFGHAWIKSYFSYFNSFKLSAICQHCYYYYFHQVLLYYIFYHLHSILCW